MCHPQAEMLASVLMTTLLLGGETSVMLSYTAHTHFGSLTCAYARSGCHGDQFAQEVCVYSLSN